MLLISLTMRPRSLSAAWPSRGEPRLRPILALLFLCESP